MASLRRLLRPTPPTQAWRRHAAASHSQQNRQQNCQRRTLSSWLDPAAPQPLVPLAGVGLTRTAELDACIAACRAEVSAITKHYAATGERFVDRDFDVTDASEAWRVVYSNHQRSLRPPELLAPSVWKRLSDVHDPSEISLFDGKYAASGDIVQGDIGSCFLLGSLAAMAHGSRGLV